MIRSACCSSVGVYLLQYGLQLLRIVATETPRRNIHVSRSLGRVASCSVYRDRAEREAVEREEREGYRANGAEATLEVCRSICRMVSRNSLGKTS